MDVRDIVLEMRQRIRSLEQGELKSTMEWASDCNTADELREWVRKLDPHNEFVEDDW